MTSLPVGATVRQAYGFAIRGFLRNLAIVWLSEVMLGALVVLSVPPLLDALTNTLAGISGHHPNFIVLAAGGATVMRYAMLLAVAGLFFRAQIMTGLTQRALGQRAGYAGVYLSLGATFWRVFGAYVLIFLLLMAVQLAATLLLIVPAIALAGFNHGTASGAAHPDLGIAVVAFFVLWRIALLVVVTYIFIRLSFVVTAVIVAEQRFDLIRAWRLVDGNVLRIFVIGLVLFVPILLILALAYGLIFGGQIWALVQTLAHAQPHHSRQLVVDLVQGIVGSVRGLFIKRGFLLVPLGLIAATLEYGLAAAAGVSGYKLLVSGRDNGEGSLSSRAA
ncbi:MAG: hypothetical protein ACP5QR_06135 [Rhizomicrobium sp.]